MKPSLSVVVITHNEETNIVRCLKSVRSHRFASIALREIWVVDSQSTDGTVRQARRLGARVVKTLNTINVAVMVDPGRLGEETDVFVAGNDAAARSWVTENVLAGWLGWSRIVDLGDITAARGLEMYLPLWLRLLGASGTALLNVRVVVAR